MTIRERLQTIGRAWRVESEPVKKVNKAETSIITNLFENTVTGLSSETSASAKLIDANREWVYRNNDVIAKEISYLDLELFTTKVVDGQIELTKIDDHPVLSIIDQFNETTSRMDGIYLTQSHKKLTGDAFWLLDGSGTNIQNIFLLDPTKVTLQLGDFTKGAKRLVEAYIYQDTVNGKKVKETYTPEQIIHFKTPNPANPYRGLGAVEGSAGTIDIDNLTITTTREFFERGAITNFVLETDQKIAPDHEKRLRAKLRSNYTGVKNAFRAMLLTNGIKVKPIQMSNKDMEFLSQLEWYRDKIMVLFGNTKASIGITDDVNRANAEATLAGWKRSTIKPDMASIVNTLNEFFVPKFGENLVLGFQDPVPEDRAGKVDEAVALKNAKIITQNEARDMLDYDAVDEGDEFDKPVPPPIIAPAEDEEEEPLDPDDEETVPKSLRGVDWRKHFRQMGLFKKLDQSKRQMALKKESRKVAEKIVRGRKKPKAISSTFDDDQIKEYYYKVMKVVDIQEERYLNAIVQLTSDIVEQGLQAMDDPQARKTGQLIDKERMEQRILARMYPISLEIAVESGNEGNRLIGLDTPYIPQKAKAVNVRKNIEKFVKLFAVSMIDTDIALMTSMLKDGFTQGLGMAEIKRNIRDRFFGKGKEANIFAERIARTEVIRAANLGINDAFIQAPGVVYKQWLSELDDRTSDICEELNGNYVGVEGNFVDKGGEVAGHTLDYTDTPFPPAHPNCRSTIVPVFKGDEIRRDINKVAELEGRVDKRTKEYKDLKKENLEQTEYITELEKIAGIS